VVIIVFLLTGQYMDKFLDHLVGMTDGPRMLYRSRHIYILMAGLLNLGIGTYFKLAATKQLKLLQVLGSALVVIATVLFVVAFFTEAKLSGFETPWSRQGIYLLATGTLLHFFGGVTKK